MPLVLIVVLPLLAQGKDDPIDLKLYKERLTVIRESLDPDALFKATKDLLPSKEAYDALANALEGLPDREKRGELYAIGNLESSVQILVEAYSKYLSQKDELLLKEVLRWVQSYIPNAELESQILSEIINSKNEKTTPHLLPMTKLFPGTQSSVNPQHLPAIIPSAPNAQITAAVALNQIETFFTKMKAQVIGQDEILKSFRALYVSDILNDGQRTRPEVFYLLGLPGNGKDTLAEAYVDALWNQKDAHTKHMFKMNIRSKQEAWTYFGSATGYVGSTSLPNFIRFLVRHSGGKYLLKQMSEPDGTKRVFVEKNPNWLPNDFTNQDQPFRAVVFVNEAHNIPRDVKDNVLKQAIERGIFPINNPGPTPNSVSEIVVPVTFIFASNEGISLLEPREKNGTRIGEPLSYELLNENWKRVYNNKPLLRRSMLESNGERNNPMSPDQPGTSEEFLNRIPSHRIHILKPLSPDDLHGIAELLVEAKSEELKDSPGRLGRYTLRLSEDAIRFITEYDAIASENARPLKDRLESFVFSQINEAFVSKQLVPSQDIQDILVDVRVNEDGSRSMIFSVSSQSNAKPYEFSRVLNETLKDIPQVPLSNERINEILAMRQKILDNAFGVDHIVDRLIESAIVTESESRNSGNSNRPATAIALLGKSSTGKTETAKQYVIARYGSTEHMQIIDFNGIRDLGALKAKILGTVDARNNPIASDFMKAYDRALDGNIAFIFDEAANAPKELLKGLYEILRESVATGFSDGKPRPMKNVTIILTGNAGEQIYNMLPNNLPSDVYERAMHEVFRIFLNNPDLQHQILSENFTDAFIARLGSNIYFFGPLKNAPKRQIAQLKLLKGLEGLKAKNSERGWDIVFARETDVLNMFDLIETEGFNSAHQGASIDAFIRLSIIDKIKARLLSENVESGTKIQIDILEDPLHRMDRGVDFTLREMRLTTENGKEYVVEIPLSKKIENVARSDVDRILTAYHEVGHEIVSEVFFGDRVRPKYVSIIEGVTLIGASFVHYAGVRVGEPLSRGEITKQVVLREAAVLYAGFLAQQLVTVGARHDAGKRDDMHRATRLIQNAILRFGLSDVWGRRSIPDGIKIGDYIDQELSPEEKEKLNSITDRWMKEAELIAREALYLNMDRLFVEFGKALAEKGHLDQKQILEIYRDYKPVTERDANYTEKLEEVRSVLRAIDEKSPERYDAGLTKKFANGSYSVADAEGAYNEIMNRQRSLWHRLTGFFHRPWTQLTSLQKTVAASYLGNKIRDQRRDAHLSGDFWKPPTVANIEDIITSERLQETKPVTQLERFEILEREEKPFFGSSLQCKYLFR